MLLNLKKVILIILDGWGISLNHLSSAINKADTKNIDSLLKNHPNTQLSASGLSVGLPDGQMGNSEVGHITIGAGRVINQPLVRINNIIKENKLVNDNVINEVVDYVKKTGSKIHFIGLLSNGGIHSHIDHLDAICNVVHKLGIKNFFVHAFTDGRDSREKSALGFLKQTEGFINKIGGKIASITGRYYAMDRDNNWGRVKLAYDALVHGKGTFTQNIYEAVEQSYSDGINDEFIRPIIIVDDNNCPIGNIRANDVVICFNFRKDRCRQITKALTQKDMPNYGMSALKLKYITFTNYDDSFKKVSVLFNINIINNTLAEILSINGKTQSRIAETEKYPHVTYFFSGGRETLFNGENRILCPSPSVATYDLKPEMASEEITQQTLTMLDKGKDFICVNFANADMVGHTGNMIATIKACEAVDRCVGVIVEKASGYNYDIIITADHGNADCMVTNDNDPCTTHTTNLVPFIMVSNDNYYRLKKHGSLSDIAPTILDIMKLDKPDEMTGVSLLDNLN